jgi:Lar family restriction alleviation protein
MHNTKKTSLAPCPFCGNKPEVSEHGPLIDGEPGIAIWCVSGDCRMDDVGGMNFDSEEQAIKAWNTRTPEDAPEESIECPGCEENCIMPVRTHKFIACENREDVGRVILD